MEIEMKDIICTFKNNTTNDLNNEDLYKEKIKIELKYIITFLKDMFPQYDEELLEVIYNYTTNIDETIIKLIEMNKEYDIDNIYENINKELDEYDNIIPDNNISDNNLEENNSQEENNKKGLFSNISNRINRIKYNKGVKYQLLE